MSLRLAIIADDLTGALDSSVPFALAGLEVRVAVTPDGLAAALADGAAVVAVNTASRAAVPEQAREIVAAVARQVLAAAPDIVFKKIDSRLKGNVGIEAATIAAVMGLGGIVVAPAVPDQERFVRDGHVEGRGVDGQLAISPLFAGFDTALTVADAVSQLDLDQLAAKTDWSGQLAVGARGMGQSLARLLGRGAVASAFERQPKTLFAFGSRDPITEAQMDRLVAEGNLIDVVEAPCGVVQRSELAGMPALLRCTGAPDADASAVAGRFADGVASAIAGSSPDVLVMGGGDTALAILNRLGVAVVTPRGEIEAGVPWFAVQLAGGQSLICAVKSGGFGAPDSLLKLTTSAL